jgi:hypothetical protein
MFDLAISFVPFFFLIKHKLLNSLLQPFRASRLRTAFLSSESLCKINHLFLIMQAFIHYESPSMKLYELTTTEGLIFTTTMTTKTTFTGRQTCRHRQQCCQKKVV